MIDWKRLLEEAATRVTLAAARISPSERGKVVGRGASGDQTLRVDSDAEREAIEVLLQSDDIRVVSEEKGEAGERDARWVVLVDPVDGSSNYEKGIPFYCTSFAVVDGRSLKKTRYALVKNLVNGDSYYAERGVTATKNGKVMRTSLVTDLRKAVVSIDVSRARADLVRDLAPLISSVKRQVHLGANALEMCLLAEGALDAMIDVRGTMRVVDFAGGNLIAEEAGAVVTTRGGTQVDPILSINSRFDFVASANATVHEKILALLR